MQRNNPGRMSGRDAHRRREMNERSLVVLTQAGFNHHLTLESRTKAIAFAEWLVEQPGGVRSIGLLGLDGGDAEFGWSNGTPAGRRAPWLPPPPRDAPLHLEIHPDRPVRVPNEVRRDVSVGWLISSELILVTPDGREYGMRECHMSSDGMANGELRPDGDRSIVRFDGRAYIVAYVPDPLPG